MEERRLEAKFPEEIVNMFKIEPGDELDSLKNLEVSDIVRQTWNMLGPLRLFEVVENSAERVEVSYPYGKSMDRHGTMVFG